VALDLVLDDSGSMKGDKIDAAKQAAKRALSAIQPGDEIGLMTFNSSLSWLVPRRTLLNAQDADTVQNAISGVVADGGTSIFFALTSSGNDMRDSSARTRHIVLLSDGQSDDSGDYQELLNQLTDEGITVSAIAIGGDADAGLLQSIAAMGNGRFYSATTPDQVPAILFNETRRIEPPAIVDRTVQPVLTGLGTGLGLNSNSTPVRLKGYDSSTAKPQAAVELRTEDGDPLLAQWQLGLGQVTAWTSDVRNRWAADWIGQPSFGPFWSQVIHNSLSGQIDNNIQSTVDLQGGNATLKVTAVNGDGSLRNGAETQAQVFRPDGQKQAVALQQSAPGQYTATLPDDLRGVYLISVNQRVQGKVVAAQISSYSIGAAREYRAIGTDLPKLQAVAAAGGGFVLDSPAQAFEHDTKSIQNVPLWPGLVLVALLLFLAEIGTRRFGFAALIGRARRSATRPGSRPPRKPPEAGDLDFNQPGEGSEAPVGLLVP
jgi:hypothetical protein